MGFKDYLAESANARRIIKDLRHAEDQHDLDNIGHIISDLKADKKLAYLAYLAIDLQKAAKKFADGDDDMYDEVEEIFYKLISSIELQGQLVLDSSKPTAVFFDKGDQTEYTHIYGAARIIKDSIKNDFNIITIGSGCG